MERILERENQMGRSKEEDDKGEIQGEIVKVKYHLRGSMKTQYSNSFIKYVHNLVDCN